MATPKEIHGEYQNMRIDLRARLWEIVQAMDAAENGDMSKLKKINSLHFALLAYDKAYQLGIAYGSTITATSTEERHDLLEQG